MSQGLKYGSTSLASAGTAQQLSTTSLQVSYLRFVVPSANTGLIRIGASDVSAGANGYLFPATGAELELPIVYNNDFLWDLSKIWFDGGTSADVVEYFYGLPS